jgi:hypothetical protein
VLCIVTVVFIIVINKKRLHVVREASVDILVIFSREVYFLWKVCSTIPALGLQNGACSTGGKKGVRFDTILITTCFFFQGERKLEILIWRAWFWSKAVLQ